MPFTAIQIISFNLIVYTFAIFRFNY